MAGFPTMQRIVRAQPAAAALLIVCGTVAGGLMSARSAEPVVFRTLDNVPLEVVAGPDEVETEAVRAFKQTGHNAYRGNEAGVTEGKSLYEAHCQRCHKPGAAGGVGPSLVGDDYTYARVATDVGMFEVIYGGASGEMQAFSKRGLTQDQILMIIAYVRSLRKG